MTDRRLRGDDGWEIGCEEHRPIFAARGSTGQAHGGGGAEESSEAEEAEVLAAASFGAVQRVWVARHRDSRWLARTRFHCALEQRGQRRWHMAVEASQGRSIVCGEANMAMCGVFGFEACALSDVCKLIGARGKSFGAATMRVSRERLRFTRLSGRAQRSLVGTRHEKASRETMEGQRCPDPA